MGFEPEREVAYYRVKYLDERKRWVTTRHRISEERISEVYGHTQYEILPYTKEIRRLGGDPERRSTSSFLNAGAAAQQETGMKAEVVRLRDHGIALPRGAFRTAKAVVGSLEIFDTDVESFRRVSKVALLKQGNRLEGQLYDVHLLWMNGNALGLAGMELIRTAEGKEVFYAQTWVCLLNERAARDNENLYPPEGIGR